jgi:hypothetical protein
MAVQRCDSQGFGGYAAEPNRAGYGADRGFGGKLLSYYFALGEYDGLGICEFPDSISVAACSMKAAATGAFARFDEKGQRGEGQIQGTERLTAIRRPARCFMIRVVSGRVRLEDPSGRSHVDRDARQPFVPMGAVSGPSCRFTQGHCSGMETGNSADHIDVSTSQRAA